MWHSLGNSFLKIDQICAYPSCSFTRAKGKSATKFLQLTDALRTADRFLAFRFPLPLGLEKFLELENLFAGGLSVSTARQNVIETLRADA